ncbi:MAG: hypothetical protein Q9166_003770 [cf. Caloplaca sp. 2 TL-2023]
MPFFKCVRVPSLSSIYVLDGRLPNLGADYAWIPQLRRHVWGRDEKQVLYVLDTHYENTSADLRKVFHAYFAGRSMPRRSAWNAMRIYIANPSRYRKWWTEAAAHRLRAKLRATASSIGIRLLPKSGEAPKNQTHKRRRRAPSPSSSNSSISDDNWNQSESLSDKVPVTPRVARPKGVGGLLTPPSTQPKSNRIGKQVRAVGPVPPIAFRAFNDKSQGLNSIDGFVAGSFMGLEATAISAIASETFYLQEVKRHLAPQPTGHTPFISVSQHLLRVIIHALGRIRKDRRSTNWKVAVINLSKVTSSVRAAWKLDAGFNARLAFGEWIVYGSIPASNVLSVITLDRLLEVMSQLSKPFHIDMIRVAENTGAARDAMKPYVKRRLNYHDGLALGHLLVSLAIPKRYIDETTKLILFDWRYPEHDKDAWKSNQDFTRGLDKAFGSVSYEFRELAVIAEEHQVSDQAAFSDSLLQSATDIHDEQLNTEFPSQLSSDGRIPSKYFNTPPSHHSSNGGLAFMEFLGELEAAAFGTTHPNNHMPHETINTARGDGSGLVLKEESPECIILDSMPECFETRNMDV